MAVGRNAKISVQTNTLDNWVKSNIKSANYNLVMNIDVEGNEEKVLKGAMALFKNNKIRCMIMEVLNEKGGVFKLIKKYGYRSVLISGSCSVLIKSR